MHRSIRILFYICLTYALIPILSYGMQQELDGANADTRVTYGVHDWLETCYDDGNARYIQNTLERLNEPLPKSALTFSAHKLLERHHAYTKESIQKPKIVLPSDLTLLLQQRSPAAFLPTSGMDSINQEAADLWETFKRYDHLISDHTQKFSHSIFVEGAIGPVEIPCVTYTNTGHLIFVCQQCPQYFSCYYDYCEHIQRTHYVGPINHHITSTGDITYYCALCQKRFNEETFWEHTPIHTTSSPEDIRV